MSVLIKWIYFCQSLFVDLVRVSQDLIIAWIKADQFLLEEVFLLKLSQPSTGKAICLLDM